MCYITFGPGSDKRDLKDMTVKSKVFKQKERTENLKAISLLITKI